MKMASSVLVLLVLLMVGIGAGSANSELEKVRGKYEKSLFEIDGVAGVTHNPDTNEIVVFIESDDVKEKVPKKLDGYNVKIEVTGRFKALESAATQIPDIAKVNGRPGGGTGIKYSRTAANRPVFGGISVGSAASPGSAGTLGLVVRGKSDSNLYILSNAHVLAMYSNASLVGSYQPDILQPGGYDGGNANYKVGTLDSYIGICFNTDSLSCTANYADAAIAIITNPLAMPTLEKVGNVLNQRNNGFYTISGTTDVSATMIVRKSGRTSGVTTGMVISPNVSVNVYYNDTKYANFKDQIMTTAMSKAGDSGSAVDYNGKFVGLLFAGSTANSVICKGKHILDPLFITV